MVGTQYASNHHVNDPRPSTLLLVGDVGGTHARLALRSAADPAASLAEVTVPSQQYRSLPEVVSEFRSGHAGDVQRAVFAVAGPVVDGQAHLTNLGWDLDAQQLRAALRIDSVLLINDLLAIAHGIPHLPPEALHTLQAQPAQPGGAIAVVAPGTGLGEAFLVWDGARYRPYASEGGHTDFAPADALQRELLEVLSRRMDHVSYERVCSGRGMPELFTFLRDRHGAPVEEWLMQRLAAADDVVPIIMDAALDDRRSSTLCKATVELFAAILAAQAGNAALNVLATGGVFLGGGMPRRMLPYLDAPEFLSRFRAKGRMSELLGRIPLHVITARQVALLGAAHAVLDEASAG
jgi:glucokinase